MIFGKVCNKIDHGKGEFWFRVPLNEQVQTGQYKSCADDNKQNGHYNIIY